MNLFLVLKEETSKIGKTMSVKAKETQRQLFLSKQSEKVASLRLILNFAIVEFRFLEQNRKELQLKSYQN